MRHLARPGKKAFRIFFVSWVYVIALLSAVSLTQAQAGIPQEPTGTWVRQAVLNELHIIDEDGTFPVRYLVHKVDDRGDITRDVIESRDGAVARLVLRDGKPISSQEDAAERQRMQAMLDSPSSFIKHHKQNTTAQKYASDLVKLMPQAMIYTYAPGQPQPTKAKALQIVLDFKPDHNFKPPTLVAGLLTGIEGRLWIDARTHTLTRAEARVTQAVDFGWGMLARIYPGGTIEFEQSPVGEGHWIYSRVEQQMRIREMMVKVNQRESTITSSELRLLPSMLSYQEAIYKLLESPLPK